MCDFKPGDEVVCVDASTRRGFRPNPEGLVVDCRYTVREVLLTTDLIVGARAYAVVRLKEVGFRAEDGVEGAYLASRFRKVHRRNDRLTIETFSVIRDGGFEEPKRTPAPAKKRERA